jgi:copper chaperone CopZ
MKSLFTLLALLAFLLPVQSYASDVSYTAGMSGIDCSACKKTISQALGKIKGVKTIRIAKAGGDNHTLTIVTDGTKPIAKADAVKALGQDSHYKITSWSAAN